MWFFKRNKGNESTVEEVKESTENKSSAKSLVVYFSASGVTKRKAEEIREKTNSDIFEIVPEKIYTDADLNWMDKNSRTSIEMADKSSRPKMAEGDVDVSKYDVIYLGFPIWWYVAPTIVNTFLEKHDFKNKKIVLFATSGGSKFGETVKYLRPSVDETTEIIEGAILNGDADVEKVLAKG